MSVCSEVSTNSPGQRRIQMFVLGGGEEGVWGLCSQRYAGAESQLGFRPPPIKKAAVLMHSV